MLTLSVVAVIIRFSFLVARNRAQGVESIEGWFLPTAKNAPAAAFYRDHGFRLIEERDGAGRWSLATSEAAVACPPWIELIFPKEFTLSEYVHA
jgi:hypothetical protein